MEASSLIQGLEYKIGDDDRGLFIVQGRGGELTVAHAEQASQKEFDRAFDLDLVGIRLQQPSHLPELLPVFRTDARHQCRKLRIAMTLGNDFVLDRVLAVCDPAQDHRFYGLPAFYRALLDDIDVVLQFFQCLVRVGLDDRADDLGLAGERAVDRTDADLRRLGQVSHGRSMKATLCKQLLGLGDNAVSRRSLVLQCKKFP